MSSASLYNDFSLSEFYRKTIENLSAINLRKEKKFLSVKFVFVTTCNNAKIIFQRMRGFQHEPKTISGIEFVKNEF